MRKPSNKKCLNVSITAHKKVEEINMSRKQDVTIADTVDHILMVYVDHEEFLAPVKP